MKLQSLHECGIREDDPRLRSFIKAVADEERRQSISDLTPSDSATNLDRDTFRRLPYSLLLIRGVSLLLSVNVLR